jgi:uncharacterized membrane protein
MKTFASRAARLLALVGMFCALALAAPRPAHADLMFTNHSANTIYVCIGWLDSGTCGSRSPWRSHGWYAIPRGETFTVYYGNIGAVNQYWYYYAEAEDKSHIWSGDVPFPVDTANAFDLCDGAGGGTVQTRNFRELDVQSFVNYTMTLY